MKVKYTYSIPDNNKCPVPVEEIVTLHIGKYTLYLGLGA